jgi:hypothetical protein
MVRAQGRAPRGHRLIGKQPFSHWKTTSEGITLDDFTPHECSHDFHHDGYVPTYVANALVSRRPRSSFRGIQIGAGLNDGWISGIDLFRLAERSVRCCEVTERNRRTRRGEKDRHPAVLLPVALSLGRPQFPPDFGNFGRTGIDPFGLSERPFRGDKVTTFDGAARPFNQRPELAASGAHLGNVPSGLGDLGEAGRRLVGVL